MSRKLITIGRTFSLLFILSFFNASYGQCKADFTLPSFQCFGNKLTFTNTSTGSNLHYRWNFGDPFSGAANTDTLANASHTYLIDGLINVKLIISNNSGCADTVTKTIRVLKKLSANYTISQTCLNQAAALFQQQPLIPSIKLALMHGPLAMAEPPQRPIPLTLIAARALKTFVTL